MSKLHISLRSHLTGLTWHTCSELKKPYSGIQQKVCKRGSNTSLLTINLIILASGLTLMTTIELGIDTSLIVLVPVKKGSDISRKIILRHKTKESNLIEQTPVTYWKFSALCMIYLSKVLAIRYHPAACAINLFFADY